MLSHMMKSYREKNPVFFLKQCRPPFPWRTAAPLGVCFDKPLGDTRSNCRCCPNGHRRKSAQWLQRAAWPPRAAGRDGRGAAWNSGSSGNQGDKPDTQGAVGECSKLARRASARLTDLVPGSPHLLHVWFLRSGSFRF